MSLGAQLIKELEADKIPKSGIFHAFLDTGGIPTIGFGTTHYPDGKAVELGDNCYTQQALAYLQYHLDFYVVPSVKKLCSYFNGTVPPKIEAALESIAYNCGENILKRDSFIIPVTNGDWGEFNEETCESTGLAGTFLMYKYATVDGKKEPILLPRRIREVKYFLEMD